MAEYHLPAFDVLIDQFRARLNEHLADVHDLEAALNVSDSPGVIVSEYEARKLLRNMPEDAVIN